MVSFDSNNVDVRFSSADTNIITVNPSSIVDNYPYQTDVTGISVGTTTITSNVYLNGVLDCTSISNVTVNGTLPPGDIPWWQVVDGDATTNGRT